MAQNLRSTPHPDFLDIRRAFGTRISLGLCSYISACTIGRCLLRGPPQNHGCQEDFIFPIFLVDPLVSASARATPPLCGIVHCLLIWNSRVCEGYEVDIYLI